MTTLKRGTAAVRVESINLHHILSDTQILYIIFLPKQSRIYAESLFWTINVGKMEFKHECFIVIRPIRPFRLLSDLRDAVRAMNGYFAFAYDDDLEERHCSSQSRKYQSARYSIRDHILSSFPPNNPKPTLNLSLLYNQRWQIQVDIFHNDSTKSTFPFAE